MHIYIHTCKYTNPTFSYTISATYQLPNKIFQRLNIYIHLQHKNNQIPNNQNKLTNTHIHLYIHKIFNTHTYKIKNKNPTFAQLPNNYPTHIYTFTYIKKNINYPTTKTNSKTHLNIKKIPHFLSSQTITQKTQIPNKQNNYKTLKKKEKKKKTLRQPK